jgi:hypothetical protein
MAEHELARKEPTGLEAATAFGAPVFHAYAAITAVIRQHLGILAAASFAKPTLTGQAIVWTTELEGPIRVWSALSPAESEALDPVRRELGVSLTNLVETLGQGGINTKSGNQSHLLQAALVVPGLDHLYLVGDRPVVTFWGFHRPGEPGLNPFRANALVPPIHSPPLLPRQRRRTWPWCLAAVLALLLAAGIGLRVYSPPPEPVIEPPKPAAPTPISPPPLPPPVTHVPTSPQSEPLPPQPLPTPPAPSPTPSPAPSPAKSADLLRMPQNGDLSGLQGCWQTEHYSYGGGSSGFSTYCFDAQGHGHLTHKEQDVSCEAAAEIALRRDGSMYLADHNAVCSDGTPWYRDNLLCQAGADGVAHCTGHGSSPVGATQWSTTLHRR